MSKVGEGFEKLEKGSYYGANIHFQEAAALFSEAAGMANAAHWYQPPQVKVPEFIK
jgi:hypothetical protein